LATKRPSYLKRQKEQQRLARAQNKRDAKREKKRAKDEINAAPEGSFLEEGALEENASEMSETPDGSRADVTEETTEPDPEIRPS
jgi:hypothetical protein